MLPYDNPDVSGADQLLDPGTSPISIGLPPPANTGVSMAGLQPQSEIPQGMTPPMGGGAPMAQMGAPQQAPPEGALNGGGLLGAAHGEALRGMAKKLAGLMRR